MAIDEISQKGSPDSPDKLPNFKRANNGQTERSDSSSPVDLPDNFSAAVTASGRTYYLNHTDKTTSWLHPRASKDNNPFTPGLPYPYERRVDKKGRYYYLNHETHTTSWLNPAKLTELKATGILDADMDPLVVNGKAGDEWPWIVEEAIQEGSQKGEHYWLNYRLGPEGFCNNRSPDDTKAGYIASAHVRVARERKEKTDRVAKI